MNPGDGRSRESVSAYVKAIPGHQAKHEKGVVRYVGKHSHDFRRTALRNLIRAGVPQSVAMRVTGHETDAMFLRYDIIDGRDKVAALEAARRFVQREPAEEPNLVQIEGSGDLE